MRRSLCSLALACALLPLPAFAIGTAFTYQGTLEVSGTPADGVYDLQFQLLDAANAPVGAALVAENITVVDGVFTVPLDFGATAFNGDDRRLRIGVRPGPSAAGFTPLNPPTALTATPYAQVASVAEIASSIAGNTVDSSRVLDGSINAADVNPTQIQLRVTGSCPAGSSIRVISPTGAVTCQPDAGGGGAAFTLPFASSNSEAGSLFALTNNGGGAALEGLSTSTAPNIAAVRGVVASTAPGGFSSAVRGINNGTGATGIGVWGSHGGSGWGVYGVAPNGIGVHGQASGAGYGVFASGSTGTGLHATSTSGPAATIAIANSANANTALGVSTLGTGTALAVSASGGSAGRFENPSQASAANTVFVQSNSNGSIPDNTLGNVASFVNTNTNSVSAAVRGEVTTIFGNFGAAGIFGVSKGTGGNAGLFHASNPAGNGAAVVALTAGNGNAITANVDKNGNALEASVDGTGNAVYGWVPTTSTGRAARFANFNASNVQDVVTVTTLGNGAAVNAKVDTILGTSPALKGEVNSQFANFGTAGVFGLSSGTGGFAGLFHQSNAAGNGAGLLVIAEGNGDAVIATARKNGNGVEASVEGTGNAIYGSVPTFGPGGKAARFANFNNANAQPVVQVSTTGSNAFAVFQSGSPAANRIRFDSVGRGYFNGGVFTGGADLAEVVPTRGTTPAPGDVVEIDPQTPSHFRVASTPRSALVAGVISTDPGMTLNRPGADETTDTGAPALALAGRVPVKVTDENGAVAPGDLLVASSTPGHAMRASPAPAAGTVVGKALEAFDDTSAALDRGVIEMLVMLR